MTISTTTIKNSYSANSSTVTFNYTFKIAADTEIEVIIRASDGTETIKSKGTHYNVAGVGNAGGGSVTFVAQHTPQTNETVVLRRVTPLTQGLDLIENDPMPAENIETAYDKLTAISQELPVQGLSAMVYLEIKNVQKSHLIYSKRNTQNFGFQLQKLFKFIYL